MQIWGISHQGVVRQQNQDSYATHTLEDGRVIALVCDGMGGARAGNIASTMAVEIFMREFLAGGGDEQERMQQAAAAANREIFARASSEAECSGMGTTMVAALVDEAGALILNEGDSRAYHLTQNGITRVTRDHSLVEDLVLQGELTREQARVHPHRNLITRAIGVEENLCADCYYVAMQQEEYILLCSDGLSNMLTDQEILYEVIQAQQDESCCQRLLDITLSRGAPDNVSVVLIKK